MRVAWRADLERYLATFVADHRGLRFGRMFGVPAGYAGKKLFSCAFQDGLTAKLPPDAFEKALANGAIPWTPKGRRMSNWVLFRPRDKRELDAIGPFLEIAARHVAENVHAPAARTR